MTVKEAAKRLEVSPSLVYDWCKAGSMPHKRFGRKGKRGTIRISEADIAAFERETQVEIESN